MEKGYWYIRTYKAGQVAEKIKYWVSASTPSAAKKKLKSDINKQRHNETATIRNVARLINANFGSGDIFLGLDYSDEGFRKISDSQGENANAEQIYFAAEHLMKLCIRRVLREAQKRGVEVKYIATTSDMAGKTKEPVRVHHHLIINKEALFLFQEKWTLGGVSFEPLSRQKDYTPIAEYIIKQVRKIDNAKKFVSSQNLLRPVPVDRRAKSGAELRTPARCLLLSRSEFKPERPQYIRFLLPDEDVMKE